MYLPVLAPVRQFFSESARWGGQPVVTVWGGPDRAHVEATKAFAKRLRLTKQQVEDQGVPVPFMSIWRSHPVADSERRSRAQIRGFNRDIKAGTALAMRHPKPMTCDIQVDLWCGEGGHLISENVSAQIEMMFGFSTRYLPVDWTLSRYYKPPFDVFEYAKVYGRTRVELKQTQGWTDNTQLELAAGNKDVRLTWQGQLSFFVPFRPETGRWVRDINIEIFESPSDILLETLNLSAED